MNVEVLISMPRYTKQLVGPSHLSSAIGAPKLLSTEIDNFIVITLPCRLARRQEVCDYIGPDLLGVERVAWVHHKCACSTSLPAGESQA